MFIFHDGGRAEAGFKGQTRDCVTRAIAIATCLPYMEVYDALNAIAKSMGDDRSDSRKGVMRKVYDKYLLEILGAKWTPTMLVGSGCKVHLKSDELPKGRLVVKTSRHLVAMIDGDVYDTHDSCRGGTRCVYGYYTLRAIRA